VDSLNHVHILDTESNAIHVFALNVRRSRGGSSPSHSIETAQQESAGSAVVDRRSLCYGQNEDNWSIDSSRVPGRQLVFDGNVLFSVMLQAAGRDPRPARRPDSLAAGRGLKRLDLGDAVGRGPEQLASLLSNWQLRQEGRLTQKRPVSGRPAAADQHSEQLLAPEADMPALPGASDRSIPRSTRAPIRVRSCVESEVG
jgi:hypothetical protein